jgi:hypothetical protein
LLEAEYFYLPAPQFIDTVADILEAEVHLRELSVQFEGFFGLSLLF